MVASIFLCLDMSPSCWTPIHALASSRVHISWVPLKNEIRKVCPTCIVSYWTCKRSNSQLIGGQNSGSASGTCLSQCCYRSMWIVATTFTMAINFWFSSHLWLAMLDPEVDLEHHWVEDHWPWREYLLLYCACVQIQCGSPPSPLSVLWAWQLEHMWNQEWSYWPPITSGMWPVYSQWPWICRRCEFNVSCCFLLLFFLVSHNESSLHDKCSLFRPPPAGWRNDN